MRRSYRKLFYLVSFVIFVIVLNGCKNQSKLAGVVYFQNKDSLLVSLVQNEEPKIQVGDRLSIVVSALNAEYTNFEEIKKFLILINYLDNHKFLHTLAKFSAQLIQNGKAQLV